MTLGSLFPVLLVIHICLAISLIVPAFLLPFTLRTRGRDGEPQSPRRGRLVRGLMWLETNGTVVIGTGVAISGLALILSIGDGVVGKPWLVIALSVYAAVLAVALLIQRPALRRLMGRRTGPSQRPFAIPELAPVTSTF